LANAQEFFMTEANKPPKAAKKPKPETAPAGALPEAVTNSDIPTEKAPAAKKEKAPALEDKPFADFVQQDLMPAIQNNLDSLSDLQLEFAQKPVQISGVPGVPDCWQIVGKWKNGSRQFNLYFFKGDIQGQRGFSCISNGGTASSIESFLIDERKMTLDLLLFGLVKRLNAQKWLQPN
jgi:Protein of unknown function (DUF2996)